ncbi:class I SAM-dependent methyltransferase [Actinoallomurus iriomotensis]|uniref:Methyltransferase n=1 Tax=Actinoallomurus iriomotensis TaxID=478107 RepID=A0A9W6RZE2_9ACTN|nr:class I SAM-dependent methyltransferase [Actinoallomurus iriomotensis]GLY84314.1 methyltransferase [Actinoallomurus iriomotensis]
MTPIAGRDLYDDPRFFDGYRRLRASGRAINDAVEIPGLARLLPPVTGAQVVDLGCGTGTLARRLADAGAEHVLAVDVSARILAAAVPHPRVRYLRADLETLTLPPARADLVVSSLALHYVADYEGLIRRVAGWLRPGGRVVKHHRRTATLITGLLYAGLELTAVGEPVPGTADLTARPELGEHLRRPPVLILAARRPAR